MSKFFSYVNNLIFLLLAIAISLLLYFDSVCSISTTIFVILIFLMMYFFAIYIKKYAKEISKNEQKYEELLQSASKLKETEAKLQNIISEQKALLDVKMIGFVHLNNRHFIWTNEAFENMLGYEKGELQGKSSRVVMDEDVYTNYGEEGYKALLENGTFFKEAKYRKKDGTYAWLMTSMSLLKPNSTEAMGAAFDITEKKVAELKMQKLINEQNAIIQNKTAGLTHIKNRRFLWVNEAFEHILGYEKNELHGMDTKVIFASEEDYIKYGNEGYAELKETGTYVKELLCVKKDGTKMWALTAMTFVKDETDEAIGVIVDITKQKILEQNLQDLANKETQRRLTQERMLQQQSKMALMGEMIGNIAHQWRQPLNQIEALKDAIVEDYEFDDLTKEKMETFSKQTTNILEYMSKTIDDFRNFFLPSKEKVLFNVCEAIKSSVDLVFASLKSHNISINVKLCENCREIEGFPSEFTQVIINIINNAKDALLINKVQNALICIEVISDDSKMLITISDNAGGIPENIIDKIFEPYFTTKFASKGTGLGLYMSKIIIEDSMSGKLSVKNSDSGAIFTIEIYR